MKSRQLHQIVRSGVDNTAAVSNNGRRLKKKGGTQVANKQDIQDSKQNSKWDVLPSYQGVCRKYLLQVDTCKIGVINAILESYGPLTLLRTRDIQRGILEVCVPPDWEDVFLKAVEQMQKTLRLKMLDSYPEENPVHD